MTSFISVRARSLGFIVVFALVLMTTGCAGNVAWLSDSSGFVYAEIDNDVGKIIHYDLAKKAKRTIRAGSDILTVWPAVSPDGKRIALARCFAKTDKSMTLQFSIVGLDGNDILSPKAFHLTHTAEVDKDSYRLTLIFWSPDGAKLLAWAEEFEGAVIYDFRTDTLLKLEQVGPFMPSITCFIHPGGKGFLAFKEDKDPAKKKPIFVDWDGRQSDLMERISGSVDWRSKKDEVWESRWEKNTLVLIGANGRVLVDTEQRLILVKSNKEPAGAEAAAGIECQHTFPNGTIVRSLLVKTSKGGGLQLQILQSRTGQQRIVKGSWSPAPLFFPAPNGKLVAVRFDEMILVLNDHGDVVTRLATPGLLVQAVLSDHDRPATRAREKD